VRGAWGARGCTSCCLCACLPICVVLVLWCGGCWYLAWLVSGALLQLTGLHACQQCSYIIVAAKRCINPGWVYRA
jgi:hypothetical protein